MKTVTLNEAPLNSSRISQTQLFDTESSADDGAEHENYGDKIQNAPVGSPQRQEAQKNLLEEINHRKQIDQNIVEILRLSLKQTDVVDLLTSTRTTGQPVVDDWDCYKTLVKSFKNQCGAKMEYDMKYAGALANICNMGVDVKQSVAAIEEASESRKTQLFDTESSADDGAEHENYGDKVDARDIPLLYLDTEIQNAPVGSPQRQEAQKNLLEEINHRKQIDQNIIEILRLSLKQTDVLDLLTSTRTTGQPVVDDWDCYKTLVKSFKNQCGAKMEYDMKYAGALANICNMGVYVKQSVAAIEEASESRKTQLFDTESSADDGAEHENYGDKVDARDIPLLYLDTEIQNAPVGSPQRQEAQKNLLEEINHRKQIDQNIIEILRLSLKQTDVLDLLTSTRTTGQPVVDDWDCYKTLVKSFKNQCGAKMEYDMKYAGALANICNMGVDVKQSVAAIEEASESRKTQLFDTESSADDGAEHENYGDKVDARDIPLLYLDTEIQNAPVGSPQRQEAQKNLLEEINHRKQIDQNIIEILRLSLKQTDVLDLLTSTRTTGQPVVDDWDCYKTLVKSFKNQCGAKMEYDMKYAGALANICNMGVDVKQSVAAIEEASESRKTQLFDTESSADDGGEHENYGDKVDARDIPLLYLETEIQNAPVGSPQRQEAQKNLLEEINHRKQIDQNIIEILRLSLKQTDVLDLLTSTRTTGQPVVDDWDCYKTLVKSFKNQCGAKMEYDMKYAGALANICNMGVDVKQSVAAIEEASESRKTQLFDTESSADDGAEHENYGDKVDARDIPLLYHETEIQNAPVGSPQRQEAQKNLLEEINHRKQIDQNIIEILRLSLKQTDVLDLLTSTRTTGQPVVDDWDCYKTLVKSFKNQCGAKMEYDMKYAGALANICNMGVDVKQSVAAIEEASESRKTQLFDTESSADDGAEHENYGDKVDARDIPLLYLETEIQNAPVGSPQRQEAQKNLLEEINHRKQIDQNIIEILRLSLKQTDVLDLLTSTRTTGQPVVDDWDCYKTLVKSFKNQCGAKMEYDMKYAGALANICNMGVDVKQSVDARDIPLLYLETEIQNAPVGSPQRQEAQKNLLEEINHRKQIDQNIVEILRLSLKQTDVVDLLTSTRTTGQPVVDDWDCYKTLVKSFKNQCGAKMEYDMKYAGALANICNMGVDVKQSVAAIEEASESRKTQLFDTESSTNGAEHENYGDKVDARDIPLLYLETKVKSFKNQCGAKMEYDMKYAGALANICNMGVDVKQSQNLAKPKLFDTESNADDGAEHENYGDKVDARDIPLLYLETKIQNAPVGLPQRQEAQKNLLEEINHRKQIDQNIIEILRLSLKQTDVLDLLTSTRTTGQPVVDDWDSYKTLQNLAKPKLFDTESSADDGAEHENYGDKVDARDIPLLYLVTEIQNAPVGSPQKQEAQKNLLEEINHRKQIDQNIIEILRLSLKQTDVLDLLTSTRTTGQPVVADWDCYKALVKSFKNQCGAKMEYDMKYAGALANICNMGVDMKQSVAAIEEACAH
ncbi:hypothetical protein Bca101_089029 [Brassica carinata]